MCYDEATMEEGAVIFTDDEGEVITDDEGVPITDRKEAAAQEAPQAFSYRIGTIVWSPEQQPEDGSEVAPPDTTWYEAISDGQLVIPPEGGEDR